ncbi:MAG: T9SS type A sorting domain-containing protein [Saprospiraceae bacterium]|nr:T9SS type A sorting domain-containing protein [Saprospiraceae bacterium]
MKCTEKKAIQMIILGMAILCLTPLWSQITTTSTLGAPITITGFPGGVCGNEVAVYSCQNCFCCSESLEELNPVIQNALATTPTTNRLKLRWDQVYNFDMEVGYLDFFHYAYPIYDTVPQQLYFNMYSGADGAPAVARNQRVIYNSSTSETFVKSIYGGSVKFTKGTKDGYIAIPYVEVNVIDNNNAYLVFTTLVIPVVVEGPTHPEIAVPLIDTVADPQLPYLVLHAPPGTESSSEFAKSKTTCREIQTSYAQDMTHAANLAVKIGVAGEVGLFVTTKFEFSVTFNAGVEAGELAIQTTNNQTCLSVDEGFMTSSLLNSEGGGDVFIGYGRDLGLGLYELMTIDPATCEAGIDTGLAYIPVGVPKEFVYTTATIQNEIVKLQAQVADSLQNDPEVTFNAKNQLNVWKQVLAMNLANINNPNNEVIGNFSISPGVTKSSQSSITVAQSNSINYEHFVKANVGVQAVLEVAGSGVSGGYQYSVSQRYGQTMNQSESASQLIKYTLRDNDPGDVFKGDIVRDPMFGTPIFHLNEGTRSSCPYQGGYQRDQPKLIFSNESDTLTISNAPAGTKQTFQIKVCNDSDEPRTYYLKGNSATNLSGAIIEGFGNKLFNTNDDGVDFYLIPAKSCLDDATLSITQANTEVYDYNNIEMYLYSLCQPANAPIASSIYLNVHYVPTTGVKDLAAEGVSLKVVPNPNPGHFYIELEGFHDIGQLSISDLSGRTVYQREVERGDQRLELQHQQFYPGLYLVTLKNERGQVTKKLVIE